MGVRDLDLPERPPGPGAHVGLSSAKADPLSYKNIPLSGLHPFSAARYRSVWDPVQPLRELRSSLHQASHGRAIRRPLPSSDAGDQLLPLLQRPARLSALLSCAAPLSGRRGLQTGCAVVRLRLRMWCV